MCPFPWTLCTQMQDQGVFTGHGRETNSSIFRAQRRDSSNLIRLVFSCSSGATNKGLRKFSFGLFHGMERGVLLYRPHVKTRDLSGFDQRWQQLCGNEPRLWKAAMSVNQPSVESWTRASRSQVTRTEIYVFINAIYFGCWFGISEFIIFLHIKTDVQVLAE